jgi:(5-formylfuran-3-yl)methyl phosphate synthase
VKQPWAALLLGGVKTIEVRRWPTDRRGRVLLHAARIPDPRPEGWQLLPDKLRPLADLRGGVIGSLTLAECKTYRHLASFQADQPQHHNLPAWFQPPVMFGFRFTDPVTLPFTACSGQVRFFTVEAPVASTAPSSAERRSQLLVSVQSVAEVEAALAGGAGLIDVKDPRRGSLGRAQDALMTEVVNAVAGRRPISAALGELHQAVGMPLPAVLEHLSYIKWGLSGYRGYDLAWKMELSAEVERLTRARPGCRFVAVAYADAERAGAPAPVDVVGYACDHAAGAMLLDTWHKDGTSLLDWLDVDAIGRIIERCRAAGVKVALAGSLGLPQITQLRPTRPDWFAVRAAVCQGGRRLAMVHQDRVRALVECLGGSENVGERRSES